MTNVEQTQKQATNYIESALFYLVGRVNNKQFEKTIQNNIDVKRDSAKTTEAFWDSLMMNIVYFVENKNIWQKLIKEALAAKQLQKVSYYEDELLAQQMRIRQQLGEQLEQYNEQFHAQYKELNVTEEAILYDYAYHSVEHALVIDFLTLLALNAEQTSVLFEADATEVLHQIEGYIAYHVDALVQKMKLQ